MKQPQKSVSNRNKQREKCAFQQESFQSFKPSIIYLSSSYNSEACNEIVVPISTS